MSTLMALVWLGICIGLLVLVWFKVWHYIHRLPDGTVEDTCRCCGDGTCCDCDELND